MLSINSPAGCLLSVYEQNMHIHVNYHPFGTINIVTNEKDCRTLKKKQITTSWKHYGAIMDWTVKSRVHLLLIHYASAVRQTGRLAG